MAYEIELNLKFHYKHECDGRKILMKESNRRFLQKLALDCWNQMCHYTNGENGLISMLNEMYHTMYPDLKEDCENPNSEYMKLFRKTYNELLAPRLRRDLGYNVDFDENLCPHVHYGKMECWFDVVA